MKRPLSNSDAAIRQRRWRERQRKRAPTDSGGSDSRPAPPVGGTVPTGGVPFHRTTPIANGSPDRYASPPVAPSSSPDVEPPPIVPPAPLPQDVPPPVAGPTPITAEEAKFFAKCAVGYFKLGTGLLIAKRDDVQEFLRGLAQDPEVAKAFSPEGQASILGFISQCSERVAIRYNLRIPYMDEVVCAGAIGIATLGFVPMKQDPNKRKNANPQQPHARANQNANGAQSPQQPTQPIGIAVDDAHSEDIPDMAGDAS